MAYWLREAEAKYQIVNPLATHRLREARQLDRDKRDVTDAEQIAELLRTGMVTETQLDPRPYLELRRLWSEFARLRKERARLKTLVKHQLYGLFPEIVSNWKDIFAPGALALLRVGWTPRQMAEVSVGDLYRLAREHRQGRRLWRFKIQQAHEKASHTVASPEGAEAFAAEIQRIVERVDLISQQIDALSIAIQEEIGPIDKYRHGRQLVKLAGINPSRRESGKMAGRTAMTHRGRPGLRTVVYMATVSSIQFNPRIKAHYERLLQRADRPMTKMQALGACMTKFLLYAFAVMKRREPFTAEHVWEERLAA
jgi:transposase